MDFHIFIYFSEGNANWALMKVDTKENDADHGLSQMAAVPPRPVASPETRTMSAKTRGSSAVSLHRGQKSPATMKTFEMPLQQQVPMVCFVLLE